MIIEQFFDKGLAHLSYAVASEGKMVLIDPARDPQPYYDFAAKHQSKIIAVIETHPHADFVSCHLEMRALGAVIYSSKLAGIRYPFTCFDDGDELMAGRLRLRAMNTPGHSPDSISILLFNEHGEEHAVFTGDTLFVGDVGRPDLRESAGNVTAQKELLAKQMYHSLREKLMRLSNHTLVYPAHGPGSLCGKAMGTELYSTIGRQKEDNYALQPMNEDSFVKLLLKDQPFVPKYFPYDVTLNLTGAGNRKENISKIKNIFTEQEVSKHALVIDTRPGKHFKAGHIKGAFNIQNAEKFETWLGSIISPEENFYLIAENEQQMADVIGKAAKIGYETKISGAWVKKEFHAIQDPLLDLEAFSARPQDYTIIDVRNTNESAEEKPFENSIQLPLPELRERLEEIPYGKDIVVHCAGGYRSTIGSSIIQANRNEKVYDLGEQITKFKSEKPN